MINSSLPQLSIPRLAMIFGEDRVTIARELKIDTEPDIDEMIEEIEEDRECK